MNFVNCGIVSGFGSLRRKSPCHTLPTREQSTQKFVSRTSFPPTASPPRTLAETRELASSVLTTGSRAHPDRSHSERSKNQKPSPKMWLTSVAMSLPGFRTLEEASSPESAKLPFPAIGLCGAYQFARESSDVLTAVDRCVGVEQRPPFGQRLLNVHVCCPLCLHDLVSCH